MTVDDLVTWLRAQLDDDERAAREASPGPWSPNSESDEVLAIDGERVADGFALSGRQLRATVEHIARHDPARVLAEVDAKRRILDEHAPEWRTVEWPHDQNGKGEAQVCRRCQNAEYTEWNPPVGGAGALPDGFVAPYVLWPCPTVRLIALPFADQPGYRDEWRP